MTDSSATDQRTKTGENTAGERFAVEQSPDLSHFVVVLRDDQIDLIADAVVSRLFVAPAVSPDKRQD